MAPEETKMTSVPDLTSSAICSVMAPMRQRDTWPSPLVRTDVPALIMTRRAVRNTDLDAGSLAGGECTMIALIG